MTSLAQKLAQNAKDHYELQANITTNLKNLCQQIINRIKDNNCVWYENYTVVSVPLDITLDKSLMTYVEFSYIIDNHVLEHFRKLLGVDGFRLDDYSLDGDKLKSICLHI